LFLRGDRESTGLILTRSVIIANTFSATSNYSHKNTYPATNYEALSSFVEEEEADAQLVPTSAPSWRWPDSGAGRKVLGKISSNTSQTHYTGEAVVCSSIRRQIDVQREGVFPVVSTEESRRGAVLVSTGECFLSRENSRRVVSVGNDSCSLSCATVSIANQNAFGLPPAQAISTSDEESSQRYSSSPDTGYSAGESVSEEECPLLEFAPRHFLLSRASFPSGDKLLCVRDPRCAAHGIDDDDILQEIISTFVPAASGY
jgi:hypothetical protein